MQKRVLDFINLKNTSGLKNSFRIMYGGGTKKEKTVFLHLVWGWQKKVWRCRKKESPIHYRARLCFGHFMWKAQFIVFLDCEADELFYCGLVLIVGMIRVI